MSSANVPVRYLRFRPSTGWEPVEARVIAETTTTLHVNGEAWLNFTCTPTDLEALAVGFLFNEGVIQQRVEIVTVDVCQQGENIDVWLNHTVERPTFWQRTSGCTGGVTSAGAPQQRQESAPAEAAPSEPAPEGTASRQAAPDRAASLLAELDSASGSEKIAPEALLESMEQLLNAQELYREAGGVHCSAISNGKSILVRAEDIGRHNTLDKLAGRILLEGIQARPLVLLTTGRISSEMLQKSARLGAAAVVSRTSPTSRSVALAEELGITLVGYARRNGFLVYTHPGRLVE
jgi:FdhD protein